MTGAEQAAKLEGEIREFVRDVASMRRTQSNEMDTAANASAENLNALITRVADASTGELDRLILELQGLRDSLRREGERMSQEIASYASSNQAAMSALETIANSLKQWKDGHDPTSATGATPADHVVEYEGREG
jgi:chromosome segregation ATPase